MVLAIDIGNTNIVIGCFDNSENIVFMERCSTNPLLTALEYASILKTALDINSIQPSAITGSIISSVVPAVEESFGSAVEKITNISPIKVNNDIETGLNVKIDDPSELGSDLVIAAVAAIEQYPVPQIIFDMGTATTLSVIDKNKTYIGGAIMTGIKVAAEALTSSASLLSKVSLETPEKVIGTNTVDCIRSGMLYYNSSAVDGMIERTEQELGEKCTVIATGGLAPKVISLCKRKDIILDEGLLLKGLMIIYKKNKPE